MTDFKALAKAVRDEETFPGDAMIDLLAAVEGHECRDPDGERGVLKFLREKLAGAEAERDALRAQVSMLREAAEKGRQWLDDPWAVANFDTVSEEFHRATGLYRPGKDTPAAVGSVATYAERVDGFKKWLAEQRQAAVVALDAALKETEGAP